MHFRAIRAGNVHVQVASTHNPLYLDGMKICSTNGMSSSFMRGIRSVRSMPCLLPSMGTRRSTGTSSGRSRAAYFMRNSHLLVSLRRRHVISSLRFLPSRNRPGGNLVTGCRVQINADGRTIGRLMGTNRFSGVRGGPIVRSMFFAPMGTHCVRLGTAHVVHTNRPVKFTRLKIGWLNRGGDL